MTEFRSFAKQKRKARLPRVSECLFGCFVLFCLFLILKNSEVAISYITAGLRLCAATVIPSLFPFMVLSELLVSSGFVSRLPRRLLTPLRHLLGLPDVGCCAVLLGMLCGFPVGAKCAVTAYTSGQLTKAQAERVILCSSGPSSAFLISAVGVSLWENRRFGTILYITVLLVSLLCGIASNLLCGKEEAIPSPKKSVKIPLARLFTDAVASSAQSMLLICAYVVFFSALTGTFRICIHALSLPQSASASLTCLLELSSGVSQACALPNVLLGASLTAFAAGWSGISVHCQMLSVCEGKGLSLRPYLLAKLVQGILCAAVFGILLSIFPNILIPASGV